MRLRKAIAQLRRRPEIIIPTTVLLVGLVVLSGITTAFGGYHPKFVIKQAYDFVRQGPILIGPNGPARPSQQLPKPNAVVVPGAPGGRLDASLSSGLTGPRALAGTPRMSALTGQATPARAFASACPAAQTQTDMRLLVLASDGTEVALPAIKQTLDYLGTPYTIYIATQHPGQLTSSMLASGCHALYQGVILTNGLLAYNNQGTWMSALQQSEWNTLWTFEATFGIRQVTWYTYPTADFGFQGTPQAVDTSANPIGATYTAAGQRIWTYVNANNALPIQYAYTYLAQPLSDGQTTPLLQDAQGNALGVIHTYPNGRTNLALTFDSNQYLVHSIVLSYGLINWVTKGIFLGERQVYLEAMPDDVFLDDDIWTPSTPCGTSVDNTGTTYRITGADYDAYIAWQDAIRGQAPTRNFRTDMTFNGWGSTPGAYTPDSLTPEVRRHPDRFFWTNHTYDHLDLSTVDYATAMNEIVQNIQVAQQLGFARFSPIAMVTPNISGLTNPQFLQAAYDAGIRYLVTDSSQPGYNNPSPNVGITNQYQPAILMVPRRPTNIYFNVSTPDQEVAEYNCFYQSYWGHALSYAQILDHESQTALVFMLLGDADPMMFHQPNLRAYDGTHSVLGDFLTATFTKYSALYTLPVTSLREDEVGQLEAARMQYNAAGVSATLGPGRTITITTQGTATVPVTGLPGQYATHYGGQAVSYVPVPGGQPITLNW